MWSCSGLGLHGNFILANVWVVLLWYCYCILFTTLIITFSPSSPGAPGRPTSPWGNTETELSSNWTVTVSDASVLTSYDWTTSGPSWPFVGTANTTPDPSCWLCSEHVLWSKTSVAHTSWRNCKNKYIIIYVFNCGAFSWPKLAKKDKQWTCIQPLTQRVLGVPEVLAIQEDPWSWRRRRRRLVSVNLFSNVAFIFNMLQ